MKWPWMEEQKEKARARDKTRIFGGATAVGRLELGQVDIFSIAVHLLSRVRVH